MGNKLLEAHAAMGCLGSCSNAAWHEPGFHDGPRGLEHRAGSLDPRALELDQQPQAMSMRFRQIQHSRPAAAQQLRPSWPKAVAALTGGQQQLRTAVGRGIAATHQPLPC